MTEKEINEQSILIWADVALDHLHLLRKELRTFEQVNDWLTRAETAIWQMKDLYDTAITPTLKTSIRNLAGGIRHKMNKMRNNG